MVTGKGSIGHLRFYESVDEEIEYKGRIGMGLCGQMMEKRGRIEGRGVLTREKV